MPTELLPEFHIAILTETMLANTLDIPGFYSAHALAKVNQIGRPAGGVSCYYKGNIGKPSHIHTSDNTIIIKTANSTLIGMYISPTASINDATESLAQALSHTEPEESVNLAGDFNCRIDKPSHRSKILLEALEEEGFTLTNDPMDYTYFAPNGSSTIDLILYRSQNKKLLITNQKQHWPRTVAPTRKHVPVVAIIHNT